jgi:hypothetical protein
VCLLRGMDWAFLYNTVQLYILLVKSSLITAVQTVGPTQAEVRDFMDLERFTDCRNFWVMTPC